MLTNRNFSNSTLPDDLYPNIFKYIDLNPRTIRNIRLVSKIFKTEMDRNLNNNFTKIEIFYPEDTTLNPISFYFDQSRHETIMLNSGIEFFMNLQKEDPAKTRIRITNNKLDLCVTSNVGDDDGESTWFWQFEPFDEVSKNYCFEIDDIDNAGQTSIHVCENFPLLGLPGLFQSYYVALEKMLEFLT